MRPVPWFPVRGRMTSRLPEPIRTTGVLNLQDSAQDKMTRGAACDHMSTLLLNIHNSFIMSYVHVTQPDKVFTGRKREGRKGATMSLWVPSRLKLKNILALCISHY